MPNKPKKDAAYYIVLTAIYTVITGVCNALCFAVCEIESIDVDSSAVALTCVVFATVCVFVQEKINEIG